MKWRNLLCIAGFVSVGAQAAVPTCAKAFATLHKAPSSSSPVSWRVPKYMPFLRFESKNGWVKVQDFEHETHWVLSRELSNNIHCVVVKSTVATLRQNPSSAALPAEIKTVDRYTPFKKLEMDGEWIKVEDEVGHQAWIHETNVWKPVKVQAVNF